MGINCNSWCEDESAKEALGAVQRIVKLKWVVLFSEFFINGARNSRRFLFPVHCKRPR